MPKQTLAIDAILPSLLSANSLCLGAEVTALMAAGVQQIHLDVMDNHYVPNLTFGPNLARALRQHFPNLLIDVHLMTTTVNDLIRQFAEAGANRIAIHPESSIHLDRSLQLIREVGCLAGLVLNPTTSTDVIDWCQHRLDFVLVMTVNPGFGGQRLIPEVMPKIQRLQQAYPQLLIVVDGGVDSNNIAQLAWLGAREFVVGSALFKHTDYQSTLLELQTTLSSVPL